MKQKVFIALIVCITLIGFFLRFWNYSERFGLAYDQAHDAVVAREALREGKIPLVGPFSSAGPFQTSGTWYWLLMIPTALYRSSVSTPWVFLTFLYVMMIYMVGMFGRKIEGNLFGILIALLTALSTAQIAQSVNLTNQTPIPVFVFLSLFCAYYYLKKNTVISAFGMGLFAGLAASIHLQGMSLAIVVFLALFLGGVTMRTFFSAFFGALLPMLPIVLWDTKNDFFTIRNMFYYYRYDQFNISLDVLGRRWLTYLTEFWPKEWAHIIGGVPGIAVGIVMGAVFFFIIRFFQKKVRRFWFLIFFSFFGMAVIVRYTRVPIFSSFITFMHPFVLFITAWTLYQTFRLHKFVGAVVLIFVLFFTVQKTYKEVFSFHTNNSARTSKFIRTELMTLFPGEKFSFYDWKYEEAGRSVPAALYMDEKHLLDPNGRKIGFSRHSPEDSLMTPVISTASGMLIDYSSTTSAYLLENGWIGVNPWDIYRETEEWRE
jgi:hypothetical protein